jgi:hypothetical protein
VIGVRVVASKLKTTRGVSGRCERAGEEGGRSDCLTTRQGGRDSRGKGLTYSTQQVVSYSSLVGCSLQEVDGRSFICTILLILRWDCPRANCSHY